MTIKTSFKTRIIITFLLTAIGISGAIIGGKLIILGFIGVFGLFIMIIYAIVDYRQKIAEIKRRYQVIENQLAKR